MFGGLIPHDDRKQLLRPIRTIQAMGAGLIQSLVALSLFFADGFRLSSTGFSLLFIGFWLGHLAFYLLIRSRLNLRFDDPSMTQAQVIWAIFVVLLTIFLEQMAITDELTGLINRRQMMFVLGQLKSSGRSRGRSLQCLLF